MDDKEAMAETTITTAKTLEPTDTIPLKTVHTNLENFKTQPPAHTKASFAPIDMLPPVSTIAEAAGLPHRVGARGGRQRC
jgi:hypothetical protein